jgi:hypothetical protein
MTAGLFWGAFREPIRLDIGSEYLTGDRRWMK